MTAIRQAYATTSSRASASSRAQRSLSATMRCSDSGSTRCSAARLEWKVTPRPATAGSRASRAGSSVSIVTFELGTIRPTRCGVIIGGPRLQVVERCERLRQQRCRHRLRRRDPDPFRHVAVLGAGLLGAALAVGNPLPDDVLQRLQERQ